MEQFEQLLTCAICLDRYKNPKLLPCQHSFCMEPCMDGLVDYVRRQVKCPECRAEHRIPYQGVQGFPTNVTLQRFLELHIEITGELPDPTSGQVMERCGVCSEKAYCGPCVHCDKKICADCKGAHMDILRREIARINNQVRRALHRLQDALGLVEKNTMSLQVNCASVAEEVDEIYRRLSKALKDRTEFLRVEVDRYQSTELRNLCNLKENLETEISNITSNCDLADKHMTDSVEWDDCELMDAKEIFLKTVEFIRNFEYENTDYNRRVRFAMAHDPNQLVLHVAGYGELNITMPHQAIMPSNTSALLQPPGPGLMRSKSDHRLATQFRQQEESRGGYDRGGYEDSGEPLGGRKFGERYPNRSTAQVGYEAPTSRYGRTTTNTEYPEFESPYDSENRPRRYRSRFARHTDDGGSDNDQGGGRSVRFSGASDKEKEPRERERVLDTEDVAKGPLSGISRLYDSPRVMKRLQEVEKGKKEKKEPLPVPKPTVQVKAAAPGVKKVTAARQVSEEDEIAKIKKQNKSGTSTEVATPASPTVTRPPDIVRKTPVPEVEPEVASSDAESEEEAEPVSSLQQRKATPTAAKTSSGGSTTASRRSSGSSDVVPAPHKKAARSASSDSSTSTESSTGSSKIAHTGAAYTTEEVKQKILARGSIDKGTSSPPAEPPTPPSTTTPTRSRISSASSETSTPAPTPAPTKQPFQSRFLGVNRPTPPATVEKKEETETSSEEESSSDEDSDEEEEEPPKKSTSVAKMEKTDIGPLLARSAQARDTSAVDIRKNSRDETPNDYKSRYGTSTTTPKYNDTNSSRYGSATTAPPKEPEPVRSRYGTYGKEEVKEAPKYGRGRTEEETPRYGTPGYTSRFLNKSKSSAALSPDEEVEASLNRKYGPDGDMAKKLDETRYPSGRTRYAALKDRRSRLSRSKSSHNFGGEEGEEEDSSAMPASYQASRYGPGSSTTTTTPSADLSRSRSTHALKAGESSPERAGSGSSTGEKDGAALSSWARYLKNKYGNRAASKDGTTTAPSSAAASSTASRRLSMGLPLRNSLDSSDDDQKNMPGSPTSPTAAQAGFAAVGTSPRSQYLAKRRQQFKIGERGSEAGCFTWPRGIAVGPDNTIVVADSSNHRVQVFDSHGIFVKEFGAYGNGEGEFDCLAGVAINRIGQFIIADRYNHRIQVLDPSGRFLRAFGSQGTADGRFNYPWGITTDALGFIYVCDKENHRVQVFQSDGMFVGKFGSCGSKPGQLEHPHYIAVSSTNRVIVSDSNNHRIQIFDVNGRVLTTFGTEGSEEGQFKFPRGVAVDDQGYICVADSGNNRIQIFHPDGTFLRAFGCWGSGDGEFKGLEGVAVMSNGNILVCDRENHRVQVF